MNTPHKQLINLFRGWPSESLLPTELIEKACAKVFGNPSTAYPALCYGPDPGYEPLRRAIAAWLADFYSTSFTRITKDISTSAKISIDSERICITGGASQNLACILQVFTDPVFYTRNIWCVSPMYYLAGRVFEDNGFGGRLMAVPEDDEGIDIPFLEEGLRACKELLDEESEEEFNRKLKPSRSWSKFYRHIIYAVPTFSNPSSKTMSLDRRRDLVLLARRYNALIITDDVYDHLQWFTDPSNPTTVPNLALQPRLVDVDRFLLDAGNFGNAVSNGSFSKLVGPGIRTGWVEGTNDFVYALSQWYLSIHSVGSMLLITVSSGTSRSGGSASQAMAVVLTELVQSGQLQHHISTTLQPAYAERYACMVDQIQAMLVPLGVSLSGPVREIAGGYFIWIELPIGLNADKLTTRAKEEENLILAPGSYFAVPGVDDYDNRLDRSIRLCLAWEDPDLLRQGIQRIASLIRRMLASRW